VTIVRSHLNRYKDRRYASNGDGRWRLIGEAAAGKVAVDGDEDEDEGEED
jgi:hypothetical protein